MSRSLRGNVIALVGASGGLGEPIAQLLVDRGAHLILVGPHLDRLEATQQVLRTQSNGESNVTCVVSDLRDARCGDQIVAAATEFGRLDGVINAAGVVAFGLLTDMADELIEELFLINVLGPLWVIKRLVPLLTSSKGFAANISAVVAESPLPGMAAYSASKAALTAADSALVRELRRVGISVCDIRPPHTETQLALHPLSGISPKLPTGLAPEFVAATIVAAIESGASEVPAAAFASHAAN
jgi:short-subunit dehydrogenase